MFKKKSSAPRPGNSDGTMSLMEHLMELRRRVVFSAYFFGAAFIICYSFGDKILDLIKQPIEAPLAKYTSGEPAPEKTVSEGSNTEDYPLNCRCKTVSPRTTHPAGNTGTAPVPDTAPNAVTPAVSDQNVTLSCHCEKAVAVPSVPEKKGSPLVFISITEVFMAQLKAALFAALFFSVPFFFIQIGIFIMPALYLKEKRMFILFTAGGYLFFLMGALFGYFVVFPAGFDFFLGLSKPGEIMPAISIENYLSFALTMLFCFGVIFELPLVIIVLVRLGLVKPMFFIRNFRYFVVAIAIVAAIISPPDVMSMILMGVPMLVLYIIGTGFSFLVYRKKKNADPFLSLDDESK